MIEKSLSGYLLEMIAVMCVSADLLVCYAVEKAFVKVFQKIFLCIGAIIVILKRGLAPEFLYGIFGDSLGWFSPFGGMRIYLT